MLRLDTTAVPLAIALLLAAACAPTVGSVTPTETGGQTIPSVAPANGAASNGAASKGAASNGNGKVPPVKPSTQQPAATDDASRAPMVAPGDRLELAGLPLALQAGRWVVGVKVPPETFATIGVFGEVDALLAFEVVGRGAWRRLRTGARDADGKAPSFISLESRKEAVSLLVVVDAKKPVSIARTFATTDVSAPTLAQLKRDASLARPLVGFPYPVEKGSGYAFQYPQRYQFVRSDVAMALRTAFKQTRLRFRRGPIGIGDVSQWNGDRPAADLGKPRHISHVGGRDVDIGLPTSDKSAALLKRRCKGVLVEKDELRCGPGTVSNVDALRLAYLLGLLIDGPTPDGRYIADARRRPGPIARVETIFTDEAYIIEIRAALEVLRKRRWIHDEAYGQLGEEGLLRPSPWHVDHVHIRFAGESGRVPDVFLRLTPESRKKKAAKPKR